MKKLLILTILGFLLPGCAATWSQEKWDRSPNWAKDSVMAKGHWIQKPDQTKEDFWKDRIECNEHFVGRKGFFMGIANIYTGGWAEHKQFDRCMKIKGYIWEEYPKLEEKENQ